MAHNKFRFPNQGARELNELTSWNTISRGLSGIRSSGIRIVKDYAQIGEIGEGRDRHGYNQFTVGIGNIRGQIGGTAGKQVDAAVSTFLKGLKDAGGHKIANTDLARNIGNLEKEIAKIATAIGGAKGNILQGLAKELRDAQSTAMKSGIRGVGGSSRDYIRAAFGLKDNRAFDEARKSIANDVKQASKALSDPALKQAIRHATAEMAWLARSAKDASEKQKILANAEKKLAAIAGRATGADATVMQGLLQKISGKNSDLAIALKGNASNRTGLEFNNRLARLSHGLGEVSRVLVPIKRTLDVGNTIFQQVNSKFNQFARMQMRISAERGGFGRQVRGAGINYGHMMAAIGAGRSAGMEDRQVVGQMVGLQTQLAQARWGEGGLAENVGRWGISVYNGAGDVKQAHEMMVEFSRKLRSLGSDMEKLQFLHAIGRSPEEMEYVANYEKSARRMEMLKKNPHMMGVLDRADILDASGFNAKADAATKIELRRREILNQNAMEQGPFEALKRSLNPENWLFSDWTARQKGVEQARSEIAMEKLTRAINEKIKQDEKLGKKSDVVAAGMSVLSPQDIAAIHSLMQKDIDNKGDKSAFARLSNAFAEKYGMAFDTRAPIEKLQDALVPITNKIAKWVEDIANWVIRKNSSIKKGAEWVADNPGKSVGIAGASLAGILTLLYALKHPIQSAKNLSKGWNFVKGLFSKGAAASTLENVTSGATGTAAGAAGAATAEAAGAAGAGAAGTAAATKPGFFSRMWGGIKGWWSKPIPPSASNVPSTSAPQTSSPTSHSEAPPAPKQKVPWGKPVATARTTYNPTNPALSPSAAAELNGAKTVTQSASINAAASGAASGAGFGSKVAGGLKGVGAKSLAGLKGITKGNVLLVAASEIPTAISAAHDYSEGNTKTANRKVGTGAGQVVGGIAGAAIGQALIPIPYVGALIGGMIGTWAGGKLGGTLGNAASWAFGAEDTGTQSQNAQIAPEDIKDVYRTEGEKFIQELRELVKTDEGLREAQKKLAEKGLHISAGVLKSEQFQKDDAFAAKTVQTSMLMRQLGAYAAITGKSITPEGWSQKTDTNPYIAAATNAGISTTDQDELAAATGGKVGFSRAVVENYMKGGGISNDRIGFHAQKVREEHGDWTETQITEEAKKRATEEHTNKLTQADYENEKNAIISDTRSLVEDKKAYDEARQAGAHADGYFYKDRGDGTVGDDGSELTEDGQNPVHIADITDEDLAKRDRLKEIVKRRPDIMKDRRSSEEIAKANEKLLSGTSEEQQAAALQIMQERGIGDVANRTESQKFKSEQAAGFEKFRRENQHLGLAQAIARFSNQTGLSKDVLRNNLIYGKKFNELSEEDQKEYMKGTEYRTEQKKKRAEDRMAARKAQRAEAAKNVSEEEAAKYLGDEGDAKEFISLRNRVQKGEKLSEADQKAYETYTDQVGRKAGRARRAKEYTPLNAPYKPTKEEQADIDAADKESARLVRIKERTKNRRPLAEYSDLRYMGSLIKRGGIADDDKELEKNFGKQRVQQFRRAEQNGTLDHLMKGDHYKEEDGKEKKKKPQMTREAVEAAYREMAESNVKRKEGESDADYKKRVDEQVASNMELYDTLHPQKKGKQTEKGKGGSKAAPAADAATAAMESAQTKTEQASQKMAEKGAAAENAAASAKEATSAGAGSHEQNITINMGGQTITQNIQGEKAMDAEGMKKGTVQGASEIRDKTAETIVSVTKSMGSY